MKRSAILALVVLAVGCGGGSAKTGASTSAAPVASTTTLPTLRDSARDACYAQIRDQLKSPASAQFDLDKAPEVSENSAKAGAESFTFTGTVDSQNGFGALVRSDYVCSALRSQKPPPEWLALVPKLTQR